jgi:hypothetical protein
MEPTSTQSLARTARLAALFHYIDTHWRYPREEKRDLRLDFLRGFAVFVMVVDHFGGASWLYYLTGNNSFFTSGAEALVLISGLVVGIVYSNIAEKEGIRAAMLKALKRAWTLYKLTVVMTLTLAVLSDIFDLPWSQGVDLGDPVMFVLRVIVLQQTYYLADIPMLYTLLMALAPIGLWLLCQGRTGVLHILSFAAWAGFQYIDSQQIIILPIVGNTTFHPAAWQLIFFWAMAVGWHRDQIWARIRSYPRWPYFLVWTLLFVWLIHLYSSDMVGLKRLYPGVDVEWIVANLFSKSHVAPGRMMATLIVFQFAYLLLTFFWVPFQRALGWLLMPLGQNSLYSYTMHVVIIGAFYMILPYLPGHITERGLINTSLQLGVLLLLWWMIRRQFAFDIVPR